MSNELFIIQSSTGYFVVYYFRFSRFTRVCNPKGNQFLFFSLFKKVSVNPSAYLFPDKPQLIYLSFYSIFQRP